MREAFMEEEKLNEQLGGFDKNNGQESTLKTLTPSLMTSGGINSYGRLNLMVCLRITSAPHR